MTQEVQILNNIYKIEEQKAEYFIYNEYFARNIRNNDLVILKILNNSALSLRIENIIRYHNDLYTVSQIDHPAIHKVNTFFEENSTHFLINEYFTGETLHFLINQKVEFDISETIDIIIEVAKALEATHKENIFHRHITLKDILVQRSLGNTKLSVKLTNIGFIHIIDFTKITNHEEIISIFPYMSPEECGVIKRNITAASDLYSLGILLYQLLTNQLPFIGSSVSSIIHKHIAQVPQLPSSINPQIPWILDSIIMKLLVKDPEKRYQSATGLIKDLERFKAGSKDFLPGIDDAVLNLSYKTNLIGRDREFQNIKGILLNIQKNNGGICLVRGKSGHGKTRLLEETKIHSFSKNITFISSKCFSSNNKTPYGPIKDLLNSYLTIFNTYKKEKQKKVRRIIKQGIKELGQILINFLPQLHIIIGECPGLMSLDNEKECKRFLIVLSNFFCALAKAEDGLVIAIDDLQWSDEGTFEVINTILYEIAFYPFLIIGTYRDNEINKEHGVHQLINNINTLKTQFTHIHCSAFDAGLMFLFISSILHDKDQNIKKISDLIQMKSGGNPFFALEILKHLINTKTIYYKNEEWAINWDIINSIEFPPTILNMVIKRISLLNEIEILILSHASVIGREFEIDFLYKIISYDKEKIVKVIDKAIYLQLLETDQNDKKKILFIHDRIKEAFYMKLKENNKKELHNKIARVLEDTYNTGSTDLLFQLAHHYIEGENDTKILEFAFPAGIQAKGNYAHKEAIKYLKKTIAILLKDSKPDNDKLMTSQKNLAEIYLTTGKYDKSIELFNNVLPLIRTDIEKAQIYRLITSAYYKKGDFIKCEEYGKIGLNLLGEKLPVTNIAITGGIIKELCKHIIHNIFPKKYTKPKKNKNIEKYKLIVSFQISLNFSYSLSNLTKFIHLILRMLNICESKIGKSKELGESLVGYAVVCMAIPLFKRSITYHQKAIKLRKEIGDEYGMAQSLQILGYCYEWMGKYKTAISYLNDSMSRFNKFGDIKEYGVSILGKAECLMYLSDYSKAQTLLNKYLEIAKKTKDVYVETNAYVNMFKLLFETGHLKDAEKKIILANNKSFKNNLWLVHCISITDLGRLYLEKNNIYKAQEYLDKAKQLFDKSNFLPPYTVHLYNYISEAYIMEYLYFHSIKIRQNLILKIKKACNESIKKTKPWKTHYIGALRAKAKYYALIKKNRKAEELFCRSIELGERLGRKYELGHCFYEYGLFLKNIGKTIESKQKIEFAYKIFDEINSIHLKDKISLELGSSITTLNHTPIVKLMDKQRFTSIIKVSQDICSILNPDDLLEQVLKKAIEISGAQSGYLFIKDDNTDELKIKVSQNIQKLAVSESIIEIVNKVYLTEKTIITNGFQTNNSVICVPLLYKNETIGVCYLYNDLSHNIFSEEDKEVLEVIMTQAAISLVNARLYELATVDGLTKLYIHRHFQILLENELIRSKRYNHTCSLIMADIDHFKKVNDTYGHQFGDKVLKKTANIIKSNCRSTDIPARYGGEEFCIILPETSQNNAVIVAEKIRISLEEYTFDHLDNLVKITISLGVSEFPYNALTKDRLIEAADKALYISKEKGRNHVTAYEQRIE